MDTNETQSPELMTQAVSPTSAPSQRKPRWRDYTAFVLTSGGARGSLQVGAARALLERGITPDVIVGTSIGSWNGAILAQQPTMEGVETLTHIWKSLSTSRVLLGWESHLPGAGQTYAGAYVVAAIRRVTQGYPSLYGDVGLRQVIHEHLEGVRFEDMRVPFRVVASNLSTGGLVIFGRGPIKLALLASAAIPGVFPPVRIAGQILVDGGALESAGIETAIQLGARRIFVLDAGYEVTPELKTQLNRLLDRAVRNGRMANAHALAIVLERTLAMMGGYQLAHAVEHVPQGIDLHVLRPPAMVGETSLDFDHADKWIDLAYDHARAYLTEHLPQQSAAASVEAREPDTATTSRAG